MGEVQVTALKGVSLRIDKEDFIAITGSSGSGKSTMMNLRGQKIGFIFQQFNLIPNLTALENVMLPLEFQNIPTETARKKAESILNTVGLGDRMHHLPSQLSGGQQQRVAIARSLSNSPDVILADEPTGNLDSKSGSDIIGMLEKLWKNEGKTIIMVTHDMQLAKRARIRVNLKDGQIVKGG